MNFYFELANCRWKAGAFRRCVERWEKNLSPQAWPANALSNHDLVRARSRYEGNNSGDLRARLLMLMLLTLRGTPFIYYGEELAMKEALLAKEQLKDPVGVKWYPLHRGRDGCRTPMQWDESAYGGFSKAEPWLPLGPESSERNAAAQQKDPSSQLSLTRELIWLRKGLPALLEGSYASVTAGVPGDCFCYLRQTDQQKLMVCLNFSEARQTVQNDNLQGDPKILFSTDPERKRGDTNFPLTMEPGEGCIIEVAAKI